MRLVPLKVSPCSMHLFRKLKRHKQHWQRVFVPGSRKSMFIFEISEPRLGSRLLKVFAAFMRHI